MPISLHGHADRRALIEPLRTATDLSALAETLGMVRKGSNWRCPLHDDDSPSFSITQRNGCWGWHCFAGCGHGDAIDLVMKLHGFTFAAAVHWLCQWLGWPTTFAEVRVPTLLRRPVVPAPTLVDQPDDMANEQAELLTAFCDRYANVRRGLANHDAYAYLARRGIRPETADAAGLGWLDDYGAASHWLRSEWPLECLQSAGLFNAKGNLRLFRHRLLLPYRWGGRVWSLQARNINWRAKDDGPKELCCGPIRLPFGADVLRRPDVQTVLLTEGVIDCLSAQEMGYLALGIPGASGFKHEWVRRLLAVPRVVIAFDADDAGRRGQAQVAQYFAEAGKGVDFVDLPAGLDLNAFWMQLRSKEART